MKKAFTLIELLVVFAIIAILAAICFQGCNRPKDWKYDAATGSTTWTDPDGRKMLRSPNGTIVELSK